MSQLILTSSFNTVATELLEKGVLPRTPLRVALIPTASRCYALHPWLEHDRKALASLGYSVYDVELEDKTREELTRELLSADAIFIAGGNTTYLVEHVHASGFDQILGEVLSHGRMYIGSSAGSILAGPSVEPFIEEDLPELPKDFIVHDPTGLGLVSYVILPHHPQFEAHDAKAIEKFGDRFLFIHLTDQAYRVETL